MAGIDESLDFHPLRIAVLTVSDTRDEETDTSGRAAGRATDRRGPSARRQGDRRRRYRGDPWSGARPGPTIPQVDVILSTGGTGFAPRDVTPEAVKPLFRREMDGFAVLFHQASLGTVGLSTLQSRAFAGQIGDTLRLLPAGIDRRLPRRLGPGAGTELDSRYRPCSLAGLVPRLARPCRRMSGAEPCRRRRPRAHGRCVRQAGHRADGDRARALTCSPRRSNSARGDTPRAR